MAAALSAGLRAFSATRLAGGISAASFFVMSINLLTTNALWRILPAATFLIAHYCSLVSTRPVVQDFINPDKFLFRRNFITRELFFKNLSRIDSPEPVRRVRLMVGTSRAASATGEFVEVYRVKVRWLEPQFWWDNEESVRDRFFELVCEAEDEETGNTFPFVHMNINSLMTGYDEHFMTGRTLPLGLRCGMRCTNGAGLKSPWIWTNTLKLYKLYNRSLYRRHPQRASYRPLSWQQQQQQPSPYSQRSSSLSYTADGTAAQPAGQFAPQMMGGTQLGDNEAAAPASPFVQEPLQQQQDQLQQLQQQQQFPQQPLENQQQYAYQFQPETTTTTSTASPSPPPPPSNADPSGSVGGGAGQYADQYYYNIHRKSPRWEMLVARNSEKKFVAEFS